MEVADERHGKYSEQDGSPANGGAGGPLGGGGGATGEAEGFAQRGAALRYRLQHGEAGAEQEDQEEGVEQVEAVAEPQADGEAPGPRARQTGVATMAQTIAVPKRTRCRDRRIRGRSSAELGSDDDNDVHSYCAALPSPVHAAARVGVDDQTVV